MKVNGSPTRDDIWRIPAAVACVLACLGLLFLGLAIANRTEPHAASRKAPPTSTRAAEPSTSPADAGLDASALALGERAPRTPYPLDDVPRRAAIASAGCPEVPLVDHVGEPITWRPAFRVHPVFVPSVRALEGAIVETTLEIYGRAPTRLLSASGYRCTTVRGRPERISEHALGNAIDLRGVELGDALTITVRDHWHTVEGVDPRHARFWRALVERVTERGLFRGIIGPPDPDHMDHLHFDQGPSSFIDVSLE